MARNRGPTISNHMARNRGPKISNHNWISLGFWFGPYDCLCSFVSGHMIGYLWSLVSGHMIGYLLSSDSDHIIGHLWSPVSGHMFGYLWSPGSGHNDWISLVPCVRPYDLPVACAGHGALFVPTCSLPQVQSADSVSVNPLLAGRNDSCQCMYCLAFSTDPDPVTGVSCLSAPA
jgi:hypothetical protein